MLESQSHDRHYYSVTYLGELITGYKDLPLSGLDQLKPARQVIATPIPRQTGSYWRAGAAGLRKAGRGPRRCRRNSAGAARSEREMLTGSRFLRPD